MLLKGLRSLELGAWRERRLASAQRNASSAVGLSPSRRCHLKDSVRLEAWRGPWALGTARPFPPYSPGLGAAVGPVLYAEPRERGLLGSMDLALQRLQPGSSFGVSSYSPMRLLLASHPPFPSLLGAEGIIRSRGQTGTQTPLQLHWPEMATAPCKGREGTECGDSPTAVLTNPILTQVFEPPPQGAQEKKASRWDSDQSFSL